MGQQSAVRSEVLAKIDVDSYADEALEEKVATQEEQQRAEAEAEEYADDQWRNDIDRDLWEQPFCWTCNDDPSMCTCVEDYYYDYDY
jgi:hypothetical protein